MGTIFTITLPRALAGGLFSFFHFCFPADAIVLLTLCSTQWYHLCTPEHQLLPEGTFYVNLVGWFYAWCLVFAAATMGHLYFAWL